MSSYNRTAEILDLLKCPRCKNYMIGPIYQCSMGHSVCNKCNNFVRCKICRCSVLKDLRNYTLEAVITDTNLPCLYAGCKEAFKPAELEIHMQRCPFRLALAPKKTRRPRK